MESTATALTTTWARAAHRGTFRTKVAEFSRLELTFEVREGHRQHSHTYDRNGFQLGEYDLTPASGGRAAHRPRDEILPVDLTMATKPSSCLSLIREHVPIIHVSCGRWSRRYAAPPKSEFNEALKRLIDAWSRI